MTTILIPTVQDDIHAAAVAQALEHMGHRAIRWFCADLPQRCAASFAIADDAAASISFEDELEQQTIDGIDVFWNRRVGQPIIGQQLLPSDRQVAFNESVRFVRGLLMTVSQTAFSVNEHGSARAAENKVLQLHVARQVGLALPPTLISNDPQRIRQFLSTHAHSGTIFKSFKPATWESNDRVAVLYTSKVDMDALPDDDVLRMSPSIFQAYVPKAFEVRVTCMGAELVAAQLDSQLTREGTIDWRMASRDAMRVTPIELPAAIADKCRVLLKRLGLVFGCMDFIVTPSGDYVFLEVNQMGQFLWVEEACPDIPLLQTFCDFIVSRNPGFRRQPGRCKHAYGDYVDSAIALIEADRLTHLQPKDYPHIVHE